ncbi:unnamed protein product [Ambrosiozyma monospora]|uniref:Unnamed protein product n=1 Tax=Ambrosiozyma monospora TaxID=43982 RepID=A0A9W6YXJ2_AMBMO|nr:unnamed protein product [Ambrosiozyma monospora]
MFSWTTWMFHLIKITTSLDSHSDTIGSEDTGHLTVTSAYNFWENLNSRGPSLRFGTSHTYNNYCDNRNNCINTRQGAMALAENNVFAGSSSKGLYSVDGTGDLLKHLVI